MKTYNKYIIGLLILLGLFSSCIDESMNYDEQKIDESKVQPEWNLNASIGAAQLDPHLGERMFVLTWKAASRFDRSSGFALGQDNNGFITDYLSLGYGAGWLRDAHLAVRIAERKIEAGDDKERPYYHNIKEMGRIWRAYVISEFADGLGSMPTEEAFDGKNSKFEAQADVYKFILTELEEASKALSKSTISMGDGSGYDKNLDLIYKGDIKKWAQYGNSLRMRIAMRISEKEPTLAKQHFEDAVKNDYISGITDVARVQEVDGWNPFAGVMSRTWNAQIMSKTFYNLVVGLGGQNYNVPDELKSKLKDAQLNLGLRLDKHFPTTTNDPSAGYFFDGIPSKVDPRAAAMYHIVGYNDGSIYPANFGAAGDASSEVAQKDKNFLIEFKKEDGTVDITLDITHTWSTTVAGVWDKKGTMSSDYTSAAYHFPALSNAYRTSGNYRVFFGHWETYFLLAEAKLKGWSVPGTVKDNYEKGITSSFEYHAAGVPDFMNRYNKEIMAMLPAYLASKDYNRVGTSVSFDHSTEAVAYNMKYVDAYTKQEGSTTYQYPKNSIYQAGSVNNDALTKIITQKYIAQVPWLPLEAWNDHRRLGLPFFENQAVEVSYNAQLQVPLTPATSKDCAWEYYPQRYRYPTSWAATDPISYKQAQDMVGGPSKDNTKTPLWWTNRE